jgi:hypothetical protein
MAAPSLPRPCCCLSILLHISHPHFMCRDQCPNVPIAMAGGEEESEAQGESKDASRRWCWC